ncbi:hypothetical protein KQH61_05535 [bacterium]|nr:hypothetical protein [bacterium]MCB2179364.1 hypothetical protein [bacterium]
MTTDQRRSEIVRARRAVRGSTSKRRSGQKSSYVRQMPPMVSRSGMVSQRPAAVPRGSRKKASNRRQYNVALGTTGAELRLPAMSVPRVGWRALSFILMIALGVGFFLLWNSPQFTVTEDRVTVTGLERVDKLSLLEKAGVLDEPVFLMDVEALEASLPESIPALEDIKISVGVLGGVSFQVVERVPVLTWDQQEINQVSWVDDKGLLYPAIGSSEGLIYVQANAAPPGPAVDEDLVASAESVAAAESGESVVDPLTSSQLLEPEVIAGLMNLESYLPAGTTLVYDGDHGFGWENPELGCMVYFGKKLDQVAARYAVYQGIVNMFTDKERKPVLISVEYIQAPFYRLEN